MPKPRFGKPSFGGLRRASGADVGAIAAKTYCCRGCGLQHKGKAPPQCLSCGRMDFSKFDSTGEANRYAALCLLERTGHIQNLDTQVRFPLMTINKDGRPQKVADYIADFVYDQGGIRIIEDFKGALTDVAALKLRWMAAQGQPVKLTTEKGTHHG